MGLSGDIAYKKSCFHAINANLFDALASVNITSQTKTPGQMAWSSLNKQLGIETSAHNHYRHLGMVNHVFRIGAQNVVDKLTLGVRSHDNQVGI